VIDWLDRYQRRHRWLGFPLAVIYKLFEDQGPYLAALITYYGFLSLFPLLLLLASGLGFVLQDNPDLQQRILDSALNQFPVIRDELTDPTGLRGSGLALVVGGLLALYGALGVAQAVQNAMNVAWAIPRHRRPNPVRARLRSLLLIATAGIAVLATTVLSVIGSIGGVDDDFLPGWLPRLVMVAAVLVNAAIFAVVFRVSTALRLSVRDVLPGAVLAAVIWQALQVFGTAYVANVVQNSGTTYGVFAVVLGLLAWIFLAALGMVLSVEINVVRVKHLYPRALLTPFTDNVDLTPADRRAYTDAANAQRHKGFQSVDVTFEHDGQFAAANRRSASEQELPGPDDPEPPTEPAGP
jgi:membrane protein